MLAPGSSGSAACPATVYEHDLARRLLGYPEDHHCEYLLSFGYPADPAALTAPNRAGGRVARSRSSSTRSAGRPARRRTLRAAVTAT